MKARSALAGAALALAPLAQAEIIVSGPPRAGASAFGPDGPPPLLWRGAAPAAPLLSYAPPTVDGPPAAPPAYAPGWLLWPLDPDTPAGANALALRRAHRFSQNRYAQGARPLPPALLGPWWLSPYPPGFGYREDLARPDNRAMTHYHLERAHRFSQDAYRAR